jgi:hypothetical protein
MLQALVNGQSNPTTLLMHPTGEYGFAARCQRLTMAAAPTIALCYPRWDTASVLLSQ